ncbi:MAG: hypothetical protein LAT68_00145 [Cyclobacteriaceae bacterium]|nr:hypothetical protein [Cyclobacteriaceae bacterium]MCH8514711.1 hypothetical protein [Cyclobacteriaceae bacterium]
MNLFTLLHIVFSFFSTTVDSNQSTLDYSLEDQYRSLVMLVERDTLDPRRGKEEKLKYSKDILDKDFDFELKRIKDNKKFELSFRNSEERQMRVKIYDILGNLLHEEELFVRGSYSKEFDVSKFSADVFVIEVGGAKYNKTKSIQIL